MPGDLGMAPYLFHQGTNYRSFDYLGVHREGDAYAFRVWAPHATAVFAVGDFNGWSESDPLVRISNGGLFEGFVSADRFGEGSTPEQLDLRTARAIIDNLKRIAKA